MLLFDCACTNVAAFICAIAILIVIYFKWSYSYWERKKVPYIQPRFILGNTENPFRKTMSVGYLIQSYYQFFKNRNEKHGGIYLFTTPMYVPIDPEYVRNIMAKDFQYFVDRGTYYNEKDDPLSAHLFSIGGTKWRNLRTKLTPTFTSGKMKMMFSTLVECGSQLKETMAKHSSNSEAVDIKEALGCFTTDIIGSCAFGFDCNSFKDSDSEFRRYGKKVFQRDAFRSLKTGLAISFPELAKALRIKLLPTDVSTFFTNVINDTVNYREENNITRKDFLQILIDLKNNATETDFDGNHDGKSLTLEEIAAQAFVFFIAGFETSSTTVAFCLYELALHQDIQQKVRDEINSVLAIHGGKITYEAIGEMKYMGQVLDEALRKYPAVPFVTRQCIKDYKIPDQDIVIKKGTLAFISILGLQNDPDYFVHPEKFDPERFNEENKKKIRPFTYLPFGEGPRTCIGLRFGVMQSKVALTILLKNYYFALSPKTTSPLVMELNSFVPSVEGGIWLDVEKITQ